MANYIYILVWKVHWVILEVQKSQENYFFWQVNPASLLWCPFSKAGLSNEEAASFHWSLAFRGAKVRNEDSVSCWAPFAEYSESPVLSEHAHMHRSACAELNALFSSIVPPSFSLPHYCCSSVSKQHAIKSPLLPDTISQWVLESEQYLLSCQKDVVFWDRLSCASKCQTWVFPWPGQIL